MKNIITLYLSACLCLGLRRVWFESPFRVDFIVFLELIIKKKIKSDKKYPSNKKKGRDRSAGLHKEANEPN